MKNQVVRYWASVLWIHDRARRISHDITAESVGSLGLVKQLQDDG